MEKEHVYLDVVVCILTYMCPMKHRGDPLGLVLIVHVCTYGSSYFEERTYSDTFCFYRWIVIFLPLRSYMSRADTCAFYHRQIYLEHI